MKYEQLKEFAHKDTDISKSIEVLSSQGKKIKIKDIKQQWDTEQHDVCNEGKRPKRIVKEDYEAPGGETRQDTKYVDVVRVPIPMQKNIVGKAAAFLFGNKVKIVSTQKKDGENKVLNAVNRILDDTKTDSQNRAIAKLLFKSTQVAEVWYPDEQEETHNDYGFTTKFRLKLAVFSPWDDHLLYPYFDEMNNMIAFSRRYTTLNDENRKVVHFECYTKDYYQLWNKPEGNDWVLVNRVPNIIGKIPVVFADQENVEWYDVQRAISRLEELLSNHGEINNYSADPLLLAKGEVTKMPERGRAGGRLIEMDGEGGDLKYVSWDAAPESIKLEIENLFTIIHKYTQTPDISFENVKGIGSISGVALRFLFMDAHLKVMDKREIFDPYLKRRLNIIKAFVSKLNVASKAEAESTNIEAEIIPYSIDDVMERINSLMTANGGKPILSQQSSVELADMVEDKDEDFKRIQAAAAIDRQVAPYEV